MWVIEWFYLCCRPHLANLIDPSMDWAANLLSRLASTQQGAKRSDQDITALKIDLNSSSGLICFNIDIHDLGNTIICKRLSLFLFGFHRSALITSSLCPLAGNKHRQKRLYWIYYFFINSLHFTIGNIHYVYFKFKINMIDLICFIHTIHMNIWTVWFYIMHFKR